MRVLLADTCVILDLERGGVLEPMFELRHTFCVSDLLYAEALAEHGGEHLVTLGLQVAELDGAGVRRAVDWSRGQPALSLIDGFALTLAARDGCTVLSEQAALVAAAGTAKIERVGVLWVFDELEQSKLLSGRQLAEGLTRISERERCRLPVQAVHARISRYQLKGGAEG